MPSELPRMIELHGRDCQCDIARTLCYVLEHRPSYRERVGLGSSSHLNEVEDGQADPGPLPDSGYGNHFMAY